MLIEAIGGLDLPLDSDMELGFSGGGWSWLVPVEVRILVSSARPLARHVLAPRWIINESGPLASSINSTCLPSRNSLPHLQPPRLFLLILSTSLSPIRVWLVFSISLESTRCTSLALYD